MLYRRRGRRPLYIDLHVPALDRRAKAVLIVLLVLAVIFAIFIRAAIYLRQLSSEMVLSDAVDLVTLSINDAISKKLASENYDYDYFVSIKYDDNGNVVAVSTNMSRINALSSELLRDIVNASDSGQLCLSIPVGNLLGSSLLLGRGPKIPVDITMLTSSRVDFKNELTGAGINQTKHQIKLVVIVDIDVILPWKTMSTQVVSEILVAETVIIGDVPQTYLSLE